MPSTKLVSAPAASSRARLPPAYCTSSRENELATPVTDIAPMIRPMPAISRISCATACPTSTTSWQNARPSKPIARRRSTAMEQEQRHPERRLALYPPGQQQRRQADQRQDVVPTLCQGRDQPRHLVAGDAAQAVAGGVEIGLQQQCGIEQHRRQERRGRSEERRVGKESVSTCRTRWSQDH